MIVTNYRPVEWEAPKNIQAYYTDTSCGDFSTHHSHGEKQWHQFTQQFNLPYSKPYIKQVHSNTIVEAPQGYEASADAIFTDKTNTPCSVVTADCVPILLCDKNGKWVAAIHAGWRGIVQEILHHCCQKLPDYAEAIAWIGPCIGQQQYETSEEVTQQFEALPINCKPYIIPSYISQNNEQTNKFLLDLRAIVQAQLRHLGISAIFHENRCTYEDKSLYSFRQNPETGRIANIIWKN